MPIEFFQITAAYSNAMLVAIMPHVSDFAQKLDLPTPQPVTIAQVERFICFPRSDHIGGRVVLTNGCEFIFDHGRMERFDSPHSYYFLQDPDLVPKFYGPIKITEAQALQIAHNAIKKLGYTDAMLATDRRPRVDPPPQDGNHFIARYQIRWYDPTRGGDPNQPTRSIEFEINATTGQIETIDIPNPNTFRADLKLNVHPPVIYEMFKEGSHGTPIGPGRKVTPVTPAYAEAFLKAILPQLSDFVRKGSLPIKAPVSMNDVDMTKYLAKYNCGIVEGDPMAYIDTKAGVRFVYSHGQVIAFYSADATDNPERKLAYTYPAIDRDRAKFFGPINMTTNEAIALVRQTVKKLGYAEKVVHIDQPPTFIEPPGWWGTNRIARCYVEGREFFNGPTYVNAEVDVAKKTLKSLYINDHTITNIWRQPPQLNVPK
ncbi:MAG: hypothetical protein ACREDS_02920 [Limisphaerales bacterium]